MLGLLSASLDLCGLSSWRAVRREKESKIVYTNNSRSASMAALSRQSGTRESAENVCKGMEAPEGVQGEALRVYVCEEPGLRSCIDACRLPNCTCAESHRLQKTRK